MYWELRLTFWFNPSDNGEFVLFYDFTSSIPLFFVCDKNQFSSVYWALESSAWLMCNYSNLSVALHGSTIAVGCERSVLCGMRANEIGLNFFDASPHLLFFGKEFNYSKSSPKFLKIYGNMRTFSSIITFHKLPRCLLWVSIKRWELSQWSFSNCELNWTSNCALRTLTIIQNSIKSSSQLHNYQMYNSTTLCSIHRKVTDWNKNS